ncbi:MAG: sigma-70 family RNA polymerase sigma factor [Thermoleophilaceae bacterium]
MKEITCRYAGRTHASYRRKATLDVDIRLGELESAIARAKEGDGRAIGYLYLRFADNVYGYARSIVADDHEAEDVAQQVFTRLITAIGRYESRGVPFSAWLMRIAHNTAVDHMRRQRTVPCEEPVVGVESREDARGALALALRESFAELPDGQREVVVLRHVAGWSPAEIAQRLGKTENSVHALHHRGRRALQTALARRDAVPAAA